MSSFTKKHDVFISFRGEDTRTNFTSHLYSALCRDNIKTYIDDSLEKGDEVWVALSQAIHDSHIAIIVFSEHYATSKWCLDELVKILQCRKDESHRQVVIPVFHNVDPSNIRKQTGSYGEAFSKHERFLSDKENNKYAQDKISEWKAALGEAANISGWDSSNREHKNDSLVIENIVKDVMQKLYLRYPTELKVKDLVGIAKHCEDIEFLLSNDKHNQSVRSLQIIGIWGMGGMGKTTIAKAVFSRIFPQYDSVSFLANVRKEAEMLGLTSLRDKLLFDLLKEENLKSNFVESRFISRRLNSKKVLIVLDDVDNLNQIDELCRVCEDVGPGSKVIITTRNKHLLSARVNKIDIYEAKNWNFEESLELFCRHAFNQIYPLQGYEDLSRAAVNYAGGVPLALRVLGLYLHSNSIQFWDSELKKLKAYPQVEIQDVLRVSFDGLDIPTQKIFLDIAFFFKDENKDFVERILNACDFFATSGLKILEDKALITISNDKRIQMHDLLQEMGLNIVRLQGIEDLGKRSRLRDATDVYDVLQNKRGSDVVEGIALDLSHLHNLLSLSASAFDMMTQLRFLKLYIHSDKSSLSSKVEYPKVFNKLSANLRYLEWHGYHLKYLPSTFCANMLVEIRMPHSHVVELWQGSQNVVNLERVDLRECKHLKNLPDLSKASKLKWVNLTGCESLLAVVLSCDSLETLTLDGCKKLETLKSDKHLASLKEFSINGCTSLKEFSVSSSLIKGLDLSKTGIEKLDPSSIGNLIRLESLNLEGLRLSNFPNELSCLRYLNDLRISECGLVDKEKLHVLFKGLRYLRIFYMRDCCELYELPDNISGLTHLHTLILDGSNVEMLPASITLLDNLEILSLKNCTKLRWLPELPPNVKEFNAANCKSLVTISALKTFATVMRGKEKYLSFHNCLKLDGPSVQSIVNGAFLSMINAVSQNKYVDSFGLQAHSFNYNFVKVCVAGHKVSSQFTYRTTKSSFTIPLLSDYSLLGIILCVVLSPSKELKMHGARIWCQCYLPDGTKVGYATTWHPKAITELTSGHVYMWCDSFHFDSIIEAYGRKVTFKFYVTNDKKEPEHLNIQPKQCGIHLVSDSQDLRLFLRRLHSESWSDSGFETLMTIEGHGEQGSSESYSSSDHVSESKSSKYQDASTVIGLLQQQGTVPNVNTLLSPLSPSVPVTPQEIPSSKVIESSEKVDEKPHGEIGMAIGSITGSALVSPYENMVSDMPITPSTEVVADPNLHSSEALASAQALIAPSLAGFLTPLALGDLSLLLAFVASRSSFVPLDPALPSFYRQFAYQALVEFLKTVRGAPLPILLESKRDCVLDQLSSLRLMAFHGAWLDDMLAPFSQQTAPSDIMTDIIKEHDSCSARHSDLLEEISNLEERLQSSRAELLALEAQLQVIADKKHMLESAHAAAACLFNF